MGSDGMMGIGMWGMWLLGVLILVLSVLGIIALFKYGGSLAMESHRQRSLLAGLTIRP